MLAAIKQSDAILVELHLKDRHVVDARELLDALKSNTVLEKVSLEGDFLESLSASECDALLKQLGQLPCLAELYLNASSSVGASAMASLIGDAKKLQVLDLRSVKLDGTEDDFIDLYFSLSGHPSLRVISFINVDISEENSRVSFTKALANMKHLEVVRLEHREKKLDLSATVLYSICKLGTLKELQLSNIELSSLQIRLVLAAIQKTPLKILKLSKASLHDKEASLIASALHDRDLEILDLSLNDIADAGCESLAAEVTSNQKLKTLRLGGCKNIGSVGYAALTSMLKKNTTLDTLDIPHSDCEADSRLAKDASLSRKKRATAA